METLERKKILIHHHLTEQLLVSHFWWQTRYDQNLVSGLPHDCLATLLDFPKTVAQQSNDIVVRLLLDKVSWCAHDPDTVSSD